MGRWLVLLFFTLALWVLAKKLPPLGEINFQIANTKIGLYQIKLENGTLKVGSLVVNVKPKESAVNLEQPFELKTLKVSISILEKLLYLLPFRVEIKDTYISVGDVSVNLYGFSLEKEKINLMLGEIFVNSPRAFILENVTLTAKGNGLTLKGKFEQPRSEFKVFLNTLTWKGNLLLTLRKGYKIKGNFALLSKKVTLNATFEGNPIRAKTSLVFSYPTLTGTFKGQGFDIRTSGVFVLNLKGLSGNLKGGLNLCGERFLYSAELFPEGLFFSLENLRNLLYISADWNWKDLAIWGSVGDGILSLLYKDRNLKVRAENLSLNNLCGISLKALTAKGYIFKNGFLLRGGFKGFSFRSLSFAKEKFLLKGQDGNFFLRLGGNVKGLVLKRGKFLWGYLSGEMGFGGEPFKFNITSIDAYWGEVKRLSLWVHSLSFNNFRAEEFKTLVSYRKGTFKAKLKGNIDGKVSYGGGRYFMDLRGWIFKELQPLKFRISAKGFPQKGEGKFTFDSLRASFSYLRNKGGLTLDFKGFWKFLGLFGKLRVEGEKFNLNFSGSLSQNPSGITGIFSAIAGGKRDLSTFWVRFFPFCLNFLGDKLTCFSQISLFKNRSLVAVVKTYEGFPLSLNSEVKLENGNLSVYTRLKLLTSVVNRFLSNVDTYIVEPSYLGTTFVYRGTVKDFLKRVNWNFSTTLKVFSSYVYKPLELYFTLALENGSLNGFLGIGDFSRQSVFGTLSLNVNLLSGKVRVNSDLEDFPLRLYVPEFLSGYLKLSLRGKVENANDLWKVKALLSVGGFVKVLSYKSPAGEEEGRNSPPKNVNFDIEITSGDPLYVETPNGDVVVSLKGRFTNLKRTLRVRVNYGKLQMLGKTFYVGGGEVGLKDKKVSLNLPLTYYSSDKTVFLKIYGSLPWENLFLEIYSVPPAPKDQLLAELLSGGGEEALSDFPLTKVFVQTGAQAVTGVLEKFSSLLIRGITVKFSPSFDPQTGFAVGIDVQKDFADFAKVGYHWFPSSNPKTTYLWGAVKFFGGSFLRFTEYSDGSNSVALRFAKEFGFPF